MTRVYKRSAKAGWITLGFGAAMLSLWLIPGLLFGGSILPQVSWGVVFALVVIAVMTLGGVLIIRTARHKITVDSEGITDLAAYPGGRVPWRVIENIELTTWGQAYNLTLTISGPPQAKMMVDVDGLTESPSVAFGEIFEAWRAATGRTQRPFRDV